ncbi:tetratricopeptide repeat protein [Pseudomarimonas arenosa]|uniref:Sel1 repeat family protein n=1 Tax=Pseudomarimonas arenosa TaxID=2774145 RepID=A0AAW3ZNL0_9GAMM|nr:sel1 repeat family protein [Pseudomarimonas arenosa]MBD8527318.1 sel1 repeat family protein [Pseudomarimonas arenosa]
MDEFETIRPRLQELVGRSEFKEAKDLLSPFLEAGLGEAWFWYAAFPVAGATSKEAELRWVYRMWRACYLGSTDAKFSLAVDLESGDNQEQDKRLSAALFEEAAREGHARAAYIHGCALMYGTGIYPLDTERGKELLVFAASQGVSEATEILTLGGLPAS